MTKLSFIVAAMSVFFILNILFTKQTPLYHEEEKGRMRGWELDKQTKDAPAGNAPGLGLKKTFHFCVRHQQIN